MSPNIGSPCSDSPRKHDDVTLWENVSRPGKDPGAFLSRSDREFGEGSVGPVGRRVLETESGGDAEDYGRLMLREMCV